MDVWWLCRGSIARGGKIRDISVHFFARHCFAARPTLHGFPLWLSPDDAIGGGAWGRMAARPSVDHSTTCPTTSQCPQPTQWLSPQSFPGLTQTAPVGLGYSTLSVWGKHTDRLWFWGIAQQAPVPRDGARKAFPGIPFRCGVNKP